MNHRLAEVYQRQKVPKKNDIYDDSGVKEPRLSGTGLAKKRYTSIDTYYVRGVSTIAFAF